VGCYEHAVDVHVQQQLVHPKNTRHTAYSDVVGSVHVFQHAPKGRSARGSPDHTLDTRVLPYYCLAQTWYGFCTKNNTAFLKFRNLKWHLYINLPELYQSIYTEWDEITGKQSDISGNSTVSTLHLTLLEWLNQGSWDGQDT
jgi:hypothetical protein